MGYFNYFIKCVIRNITHRLCKPKTLLFILIFAVLLSFCSSAFAATAVDPTEWDTNLPGAEQHDNIYDTLRNIQIDYQNQFITKVYALYSINPTEWKTNIQYLFNDFTYAGSGQRGILVTFNDGVFYVSTYAYTEVYKNTSDSVYSFSNIHFNSTSFDSATVSRRYLTANNVFYGSSGEITTQTEPSAFFFVLSERWIDLFIDFGIITPNTDAEILSKLQELINRSNSSNTEIKDAIQEGNQLQQEQNQIQQEQNDLIKDDNVNTDGLRFAQDDTTNPTTDGFNSLFNTVYNAFCTTSSEPLTISLPYIDKSFTIQPNLVSNGMQKAGLGVVVTLINSFYYYSVCLYIYKDISHIIDNLKSGNITSDCGNVKTEVL